MREEMNARDSFDLIKEMQTKTSKIEQRIFRKVIPNNKYFERDLQYIVGSGDDLKPNGLYQLQQKFVPYFGQLNMVLVLLEKMKKDTTGSTENQLLGMAEHERRELKIAVINFGAWITQCNKRIDEKNRDLQ